MGALDRVTDAVGRLDRARREILFAGIALVALLVIGTVGYMLIEDMTAMDGLFMTFITLTTIGFSEVDPLSDPGRLFTILISIFGIGTVAFVATRSAQLLVSSQRLQERLMRRKIADLSGHHIVCGYGRLGQRITRDLLDAGREVVVIEQDPERVAELAERNVLHVDGDAEEDETLLAAGLERAGGLILALREDSANVFVALSARGLRQDLFILGRSSDHRNVPKLVRAGVDKVISPYEIGADRMAQVVLRPNVDAFMEEALSIGGLDLSMDEVQIAAGSALAGKTLVESNFRQAYDIIVVAVKGEAEGWRYNPSAQEALRPGDILIVLGDRDRIARLRRAATSPTTASLAATK